MENTTQTNNDMRKLILFFTVSFLLLAAQANAQQDPMFTKYMFNPLVYNPAVAGTPDYMTVRVLYRDQWWGIEGAPHTQSMSIHTPWRDRIGLGLSVVNDGIGATGSTSAYFSYAYRFQFGAGKLSIGLQAGAMNWRADWSKLRFKDPRTLDQSFMDIQPNYWLPNFGAGVFYYAPKFYVGFSVPHLINYDLRRDAKDSPVSTNNWAKLYRHYFLTAGAVMPINGDALIFKPSILIKRVGLFGDFSKEGNSLNQVGAPTEFDIDLSFLFYESFWVGTSFRSSVEALFSDKSSTDSVDLWASFYLRNGFRIGAAYDYTLTSLREPAQGSFEIMLGYDFNYELNKFNTPRYF